MKLRTRCAVILAITVLIGTTLLAETGGRIPSLAESGSILADAYGTASVTIHTIQAWDFETLFQTDTYVHTPAFARHQTGSSTGFWGASVNLPTGVVILGMGLQGCDKSTPFNIQAALWTVGVDTDLETETAQEIGFVTTSGDTECDLWFAPLPVPHTVDNSDTMYRIVVAQAALDGSLLFQGVRIFTQRQISPAPGAATFSDVPTSHPLFQFVEALAASGITAGCGGGNFCPNDAITRGQMAVFLAKALGLHWPN